MQGIIFNIDGQIFHREKKYGSSLNFQKHPEGITGISFLGKKQEIPEVDRKSKEISKFLSSTICLKINS